MNRLQYISMTSGHRGATRPQGQRPPDHITFDMALVRSSRLSRFPGPRSPCPGTPAPGRPRFPGVPDLVRPFLDPRARFPVPQFQAPPFHFLSPASRPPGFAAPYQPPVPRVPCASGFRAPALRFPALPPPLSWRPGALSPPIPLPPLPCPCWPVPHANSRSAQGSSGQAPLPVPRFDAPRCSFLSHARRFPGHAVWFPPPRSPVLQAPSSSGLHSSVLCPPFSRCRGTLPPPVPPFAHRAPLGRFAIRAVEMCGARMVELRVASARSWGVQVRRIPNPCVRPVLRGRAGKIGVSVIQGSGAQACGVRGPIVQGPRFRGAQGAGSKRPGPGPPDPCAQGPNRGPDGRGVRGSGPKCPKRGVQAEAFRSPGVRWGDRGVCWGDPRMR